MDIRNWPLDRIMQLPDCCFGRRWPICVEAVSFGATPVWDISELGLPDKTVFWEVNLEAWTAHTAVTQFRLALGDQLPTTVVMMDALDPLVMGLGLQGVEPRVIQVRPGFQYTRWSMRQYVPAQGRRIILEVTSADLAITWVRVVCVVSSIPTEVPDWLLSGRV